MTNPHTHEWITKNKDGLKEWNDALDNPEHKEHFDAMRCFLGTEMGNDTKLEIIKALLADKYVQIWDRIAGTFILVPENKAKDIRNKLDIAHLAIEQATEWHTNENYEILPWSIEETTRLHNRYFVYRASVEELCKLHNRTKDDILEQLKKMNLVRFDALMNKYVQNFD